MHAWEQLMYVQTTHNTHIRVCSVHAQSLSQSTLSTIKTFIQRNKRFNHASSYIIDGVM